MGTSPHWIWCVCWVSIVCHVVDDLGHICKCCLQSFCLYCCLLLHAERIVICFFRSFDNVLWCTFAECHHDKYTAFEFVQSVVYSDKRCLVQSGVDIKLAKSILKHLEWLLGSKRLCHQEACCVCVREGCWVLSSKLWVSALLWNLGNLPFLSLIIVCHACLFWWFVGCLGCLIDAGAFVQDVDGLRPFIRS